MEYLVIFEKGENSYGAYAPDLPGCGVVGDTIEEAAELIDQAIEIHIEGMKRSGEAIPQPTPILSLTPSGFIAIGIKKVEEGRVGLETPEGFFDILKGEIDGIGEYQKYFDALKNLPVEPPDSSVISVVAEYADSSISYGDLEDA